MATRRGALRPKLGGTAKIIEAHHTCRRVQERFEHVHATLAPFLHSICGFRPANVQWLPAVGPSGQNLVAQPGPDSALASWWKGPTLAQAIDGFYPRERLTGEWRGL